jgi:hypothetical protein
MKYIEIILKLAFLLLAIVLFVTKAFVSPWFFAFLVVSFILGIVLFFNKHESYGYPAGYSRMNRVYLTRKIEGVLLVAFSIIFFVLIR